MLCFALHFVLVLCTSLCSGALHCTLFWCFALHFVLVLCTALCSGALHCTLFWCFALHFVLVLCTALCSGALHCTLLSFCNEVFKGHLFYLLFFRGLRNSSLSFVKQSSTYSSKTIDKRGKNLSCSAESKLQC